jgi:phage tail sheath gpL-like
MSNPIFSFTRNPGTKVSTKVIASGLVTASNNLVIIGNMAASGSTVPVGVPVGIDNYGDPVAALAECITKFGTGSQIAEQVVGAIKGVLFSDIDNPSFPPIVVVPMASTAVAADLAALLPTLMNLVAPYVVVAFKGTDAAAEAALQSYVQAISTADRGRLGQFGSFGFMAVDEATSVVTPVGLTAASQNMCFPWLRDLAVTPANKAHVVAAAYAALCASLGVPYLPLDGVRAGGLVAPVSAADYHTDGDAGTASLGLAAGLTPLFTQNGKITVSRSVTSLVTVSGIADVSYFDMQDWQVLYFLRANAYNIALQPRYRIAKNSQEKRNALKSELIDMCLQAQALDMLQFVEKFAADFTAAQSPLNRSASVFRVPTNVIPGFHNKGIEIDGTTKFDLVVS